MKSALTTKCKISAVALCLLMSSASALATAPSATAEACVGESREGDSRYLPLGPGNGPREVKTFYLNSCEARALHDEVNSGKDGDALVTALLGLIPKGGPVITVAHVLGSRIDAAIATSSLKDASNDFTNGVVVTTEAGSFAGARPQ